jgi:predicted nucleotidyltransferase
MNALQDKLSILPSITSALADYHVQAVVLFGSLARHIQGMPLEHEPQDIDLLVVGNNVPPTFADRYSHVPLELLRFRLHPFVAIARSLRYDPRPMALARLYGDQLSRQHARNVIAACLLLGPRYREFGIEQIEVDSLEDTRDYSVQRVLHGEQWWQRLSRFARERRGPLKRFSDKITGSDQFG